MPNAARCTSAGGKVEIGNSPNAALNLPFDLQGKIDMP